MEYRLVLFFFFCIPLQQKKNRTAFATSSKVHVQAYFTLIKKLFGPAGITVSATLSGCSLASGTPLTAQPSKPHHTGLLKSADR
jgi:hypothetical protein